MSGLGISMVGVVASDLEASARFYRRLGVDVPDVAGKRHVEVRMGDLTFFLTTPEQNLAWDPNRPERGTGGYRMVLEFSLEQPDALDAKHAELVGHGYGRTGHLLIAFRSLTPSSADDGGQGPDPARSRRTRRSAPGSAG